MAPPSVQPSLAHRPLLEWGVRLLLAACAVWLGYGAGIHSLANAVRSSSPNLAYELAPHDGRIAAAFASYLSGPDATVQERRRADMLARAALRRDATSVSALSTLGLNAQIRGDTSMARRVFAYVQKLTRRDLRAQLWAIEDAVSRGDIPGVLKQYDLAFRTQKKAGALLFPVLSNAIVEPSVRQELVRMLATKPPWGSDFVSHVAAASPDPRSTVALLDGLHRAGVPVPELANGRVIDALLATGDAETAWRYYAALHPGVQRSTSRNPRFTVQHGVPARFDWIPVDDSVLMATLEISSRGGSFDYATSPGMGGPLLRQMQMLPPGDYTIEGAASIERTDAPPPYWLLACANGRELGQINVLPGRERFAGTVQVPAGCPLQALILVARSSEQLKSVTGRVTEAFVHPVSDPL